MQKYITAIIIFFSVIISPLLYAQNNYVFIENKGQFHPNVLYKCDIPSGVLFLEKNTFTYNFYNRNDIAHSHAHHNTDDCKKIDTVRFHAYKVVFLNAIPNVQIISRYESSDYANYFIGSDPKKWATNVKNYALIEYINLYKNIDMRIYSRGSTIKYEFIVRCGGNINDIKMQYIGIDSLYTHNNHLFITTSVNQLSEPAPFAYQGKNSGSITIPCIYKIKNNIVSFKFPDGYNKRDDLIIDPSLIFSTYSGSRTDNWGFTATYDYKEYVYSGGIVQGTGYPTSLGAYQVIFGGGEAWSSSWYQYGWDIGIIKYSADGRNRIFATYLGGNGNELPHSLVVTKNNELCIFGTTGSANFPTTENAYDRTFNGGTNVVYDNVIRFTNGIDIFISKLSEDGNQLLASTFIGGTKNDGLNFRNNATEDDSLYYNYADGARGEIITDDLDNIYVGSCTFSSDFPVTQNAFNTTYSGNQEGIVFKFNPNLSTLMWSSYIGGSGDDAIYSLDLDNNYDVYIAGGTNSPNLQITPNAYKTTYSGGTADGFVSFISNDGSTLIGSTYFGSYAYDQVYFVRIDKNNAVYITGQTEAGGNTFIYNATYNISNSGQFITKLNSNLTSVIWSTAFGKGDGKPNISPTAFAVDICNRIYLSGWGREWGGNNNWTNPNFGIKGMQITPDAYQKTTDGQDFYIMVMASDASKLDYATFFGELHYTNCAASGRDHVDGGTSRFDKKGNIIQSVCASCGGCQGFPTYPNPGAWSNTNNDTSMYNCNNAVFKFKIFADYALADFDLPTPGCLPYTVNFNNTSLGVNFIWFFSDDSSTTTQKNPIHTFNKEGTFDIMLIAIDSLRCNPIDTVIKHITIESLKTVTTNDTAICAGDTIQLNVTANYSNVTHTWSDLPNFSRIINRNSSPTVSVSPNKDTYYYVKTQSQYCTNIDTVLVKVLNIKANAIPVVCHGDTSSAFVTITSGTSPYTYFWNDNKNQTTSRATGLIGNTYYSVTVTDQYKSCSDRVFLTDPPLLKMDTFVQPMPCLDVCKGKITLSVSGGMPSYNYTWSNNNHINTNSNLCSGTYSVTVRDMLGCTITNTFHVGINYWIPPINAYADDTLLYAGKPTGLHAIPIKNNYSYSWTWFPIDGKTGVDNPTIHNPNGYAYQNTTFYVTVLDSNGCTNIDSVKLYPVEVLCQEPYIFVPNAFTPNNDGNNDILYVESDIISEVYFAIYDRWGEIIFETTDLKKGWDGTYNKRPCDPAVFVYYIEAICWNKQKFFKKGNITLIR